MYRSLFTVLAAACLGAPALAHFVFIVPQSAGKDVQIVFSEGLEPDEGVPIEKLTAMTLFARDDAGKDQPVKFTVGKSALIATVPSGSQRLFGSLDYGVLTKKGEPFLLRYHAQAFVKDGLNASPIGDKAGFEVVPVGKAGSIRFQSLARGKAVPAAEFTILTPKGESLKSTADADGRSSEQKETGRYGVWAKMVEKTAGKAEGRDYAEIRHYASVVVDVPAK